MDKNICMWIEFTISLYVFSLTGAKGNNLSQLGQDFSESIQILG